MPETLEPTSRKEKQNMPLAYIQELTGDRPGHELPASRPTHVGCRPILPPSFTRGLLPHPPPPYPFPCPRPPRPPTLFCFPLPARSATRLLSPAIRPIPSTCPPAYIP